MGLFCFYSGTCRYIAAFSSKGFLSDYHFSSRILIAFQEQAFRGVFVQRNLEFPVGALTLNLEETRNLITVNIASSTREGSRKGRPPTTLEGGHHGSTLPAIAFCSKGKD